MDVSCLSRDLGLDQKVLSPAFFPEELPIISGASAVNLAYPNYIPGLILKICWSVAQPTGYSVMRNAQCKSVVQEPAVDEHRSLRGRANGSHCKKWSSRHFYLFFYFFKLSKHENPINMTRWAESSRTEQVFFSK